MLKSISKTLKSSIRAFRIDKEQLYQREDEDFHSANEFLRLSDFKIGERAYAQLLHAHVGQPQRELHPMLYMDEVGEFHPVEVEGATDGHCAH